MDMARGPRRRTQDERTYLVNDKKQAQTAF